MPVAFQMGLNQRKQDVHNIQCVHSKVIGQFFENLEDHWTVDDISCPIICNPDIETQTFLKEKEFLAALQSNGVVTLLFTVGQRQKFPLCSNINCSKLTKCKCYRKFKKIISENDDDTEYYWDRKKGGKPDVIEHFLGDIPVNTHHVKFGYNQSKIIYPLKNDKPLQKNFVERLLGTFDLPEAIKPNAEDKMYVHGNLFVSEDSCFQLISPSITIYTETHDKIMNIPNFVRPTASDCNCVDQADTHTLLLWNLGSGKFVDYLFLHNHLLRMVSSGIAMNAAVLARQSALTNCGLDSTLSYNQFVRACTGYVHMVNFASNTFLCPNCGTSPKYIVCDGKTDGPTKRKVDHLQELDSPTNDDNYLSQGSYFSDRVFMPNKPERDLVCRLLTESISVDDFLESDVITSENGTLVETLVRRIDENWPDEIPEPYKNLIGNICKISSVPGYLQILTPESLDYLEDFCYQNLNIRSTQNLEKQEIVDREMPALWPNLVAIMNLEKSNYLPADVANIVLKLISIRRNTFVNSAVRSNEDYILWENTEQEHPTQFYPNWKL